MNNINKEMRKMISGYTHFALRKADNKIMNGWDYKGIDADELTYDKKHYFIFDLNDMDIPVKDVKIVGKKFLIRNGIDPLDINNWFKFE